MEKRAEVVRRIEATLQSSKIVQPSIFLGGLLKIYDHVYFKRQLLTRLTEVKYGKYPTVRVCDPKRNTSVFDCDLNIVYDISGNPTTIEFIFSPLAWTQLSRKSYYTSIIRELQGNSQFPLGNKYVMYTCMYILEHSLIHLLMVLWKYLDKKLSRHSKLDPEIYSSHGELYKCLLREYFGYSLYAIPTNVTTHHLGKSIERKAGSVTPLPRQPREKITSHQEDIRGMLKWSSNSCFFDSLMMIIFYGSSEYIRGTIKNSDLKIEEDPDGEYVNPYPNATKTRTVEGFEDLFNKTREYFLDNSEKLLEGKIFHSINLRNALAKVDPFIGNGTQYESSSVYAALALLFRELLITNIKVKRRLENGKVKNTYITPTPFVSMFDFVTLNSSIGDTEVGDTHLWETCDEPILVFYIRQSPWLKRWSDPNPESVSVIDPSQGRVLKTYEKPNPFGEYILEDRYRLFGVVVHSGVAPETLLSVTSGHYTSLFRPYFDPHSWYYYDDTVPSMSKVSEGSVPASAFIDTGKLRPHMLFYERVR